MSRPREAGELVEFIRDGLGCGCPARVLADLRIDREPEAFAGLAVDATLDVGGRLLVAVCTFQPGADLNEGLRQCVETGKRLRDQGGFNRFRLVLAATETEEAVRALERRFRELSGRDDRLHLHIVEPSTLPDVLR